MILPSELHVAINKGNDKLKNPDLTAKLASVKNDLENV